ncbi:tetratricopeptide repeat protein [Scytonema sp. PCC 10023]|uniref:tetratricopeptide repeat protein n=1 Tax=Scytonema sp. PCC 10023 TaxID=1680591 RepID=UPI0039C5F1A6
MEIKRHQTIFVIVLTLCLAVTPGLVAAQSSIEQLLKQVNAAESVGNYSQAENIWRRVLQLEPNNSNAYNNLGNALRQQKKLDKAIDAYKKAIQIDGNFADAYNGLGNALYDQRKYDQKKLDKAIDAFQKAIQLDPNYADAYNGLGNALYDQKKLDQAIDAFQKAIEFDSDHAYAYNGLGNALTDQKKLDAAIDAFQKAIQLNPKFVDAHNGLGNAFYDQKKLDEAIAAYKTAIQLYPKHAYAYTGLGNALYDQKKLDEAIDAFQKAIQFNPKHPYPYNGLGNALRDQKKLDEAIRNFQKAIQLKPNFANAYNGLGIALYDQNKFTEAITKFQKAIQLDPNYADAYYNLGIGMGYQKKFDAAIAAFQKAITLQEQSSTTPPRSRALAHNGLGFAFQQQGKLQQGKLDAAIVKLDAALVEFGKAEDIDPSFVYASNNYNETENLRNTLLNALGKVDDDRQWLPKDDPSVPVKRSVVHIVVPISAKSFTRERQGPEVGTGIVIQRKANRTLILTNRHVIFEGNKLGENIQVEFFSMPPKNRVRMRRDAKLVKTTSDKEQVDLAVLEVIGNLPEDIQPLPISSTPITPKIPTRIIGHSASREENLFWFVESREISSSDKQNMQISQPVLVPGYSGSPVIDSQNRLLGIVFGRRGEQKSFAYPMSVILEKLRTWKVL